MKKRKFKQKEAPNALLERLSIFVASKLVIWNRQKVSELQSGFFISW